MKSPTEYFLKSGKINMLFDGVGLYWTPKNETSPFYPEEAIRLIGSYIDNGGNKSFVRKEIEKMINDWLQKTPYDIWKAYITAITIRKWEKKRFIEQGLMLGSTRKKISNKIKEKKLVLQLYKDDIGSTDIDGIYGVILREDCFYSNIYGFSILC